jgi:hypothetical protein
MRHPIDGVLRRLLDEPAGVATADADHVAGCERCLDELSAIRDDADVVDGALADGVSANVDVDVGAAWQRLSAAPAGVRTSTVTPLRRGRSRRSLRRPVVAVVAAALLMTGAGAAAANGWFEIFRTERIAPMRVDLADLNALPDLRAYGNVVVEGDSNVHAVPDAATAAEETGLDVPEVTNLPPGTSGQATYQVVGELSVTFTFSAERATDAAAAAGEEPPPVPAELDGTRIRLVAGPGVAVIWPHASGVPAVIVGRAVAPTASSSSGVAFDAMRDYLLSLPGVPDDVAAMLSTINADASTLPLPVPADHVTTSSTEVGGEPATVFTTRDGAMAAVTWVHDGMMSVVVGPLGADEVVAIARGVR